MEFTELAPREGLCSAAFCFGLPFMMFLSREFNICFFVLSLNTPRKTYFV